MNNIKVLGKFLDQPILVTKFQKTVPSVLMGSIACFTGYKTVKAPESNKKETAIKTGITAGAAGVSALSAPYIASKITKRAMPEALHVIENKTKNLVDEFVKTQTLDKQTQGILEKSKNHILNFKEINNLYEKFSNSEKGQAFLDKLIPKPQNVSAKDIFSEIGYLSILGAVPVVGGITGGIISDKITDKNNWKDKIPNKIKEGAYQYLANIFLCNVGAGVALGILEKAGIQSKSARAVGMTMGIIATGIIGGSKIANLIGKKVIDPLCNRVYNKDKHNSKKPFDCMNKTPHSHKDRTPEILDIGLHTDDIATVSMLSGLKWIEPALPVMYSFSGYRAGIGYRN